jgi:hypothetical protein
VVALAAGIDHRAIEMDVEPQGRLHEGGVARRQDAAEEDAEKHQPEEDGSHAVHAEAALGSVAARYALLDRRAGDRAGSLRSRLRRRPRLGQRPWNDFDGHYSYCSRYLRTM